MPADSPIADDKHLATPPLNPEQKQEAEKRVAVTVQVVHEAIRKQGEDELSRPISALPGPGSPPVPAGQPRLPARLLDRHYWTALHREYTDRCHPAACSPRPRQRATSYFLPTLLGNVLGGVSLVSLLNHAQVASGDKED